MLVLPTAHMWPLLQGHSPFSPPLFSLRAGQLVHSSRSPLSPSVLPPLWKMETAPDSESDRPTACRALGLLVYHLWASPSLLVLALGASEDPRGPRKAIALWTVPLTPGRSQRLVSCPCRRNRWKREHIGRSRGRCCLPSLCSACAPGDGNPMLDLPHLLCTHIITRTHSAFHTAFIGLFSCRLLSVSLFQQVR